MIEKPPPGRDLWELFNDISFDFGKWTIMAESISVIDETAMLMKGNGSRKFLITGCIDAKGSPEYNHKLFERRAAAVVDVLVKKGVTASALKSKGSRQKDFIRVEDGIRPDKKGRPGNYSRDSHQYVLLELYTISYTPLKKNPG